MARATFVKSAQKDIYEKGKYVKYTSEKGKRKGQELTKLDRTVPQDKNDKVFIAKGESYYWWAFKNGGKHFSKTQPKPSQLTQSAYLSTLYDIQESMDEIQVNDPTELESVVEDIKSNLESLKDETENSLSNMPDSLQSSPTGELLQERIDALENAISEFDSLDLSYDEPDDETLKDELVDEYEGENDSYEPTEEQIEERRQQKAQDWINEKVEEIQCISLE